MNSITKILVTPDTFETVNGELSQEGKEKSVSFRFLIDISFFNWRTKLRVSLDIYHSIRVKPEIGGRFTIVRT